MLITPAYANGPAVGGFDFMAFAPLVLIFVVFYFLILRPQQKKIKQHQHVLANLRRGDRVITSGGIIGTISKILSDQEVQLEIADDVKVRLVRAMITEVMSKVEPVANEDKDAAQSKTAKKTNKE